MNQLIETNKGLASVYEQYQLKNYSYEQVIQMDSTMKLYNVKMNYENLYEKNTQMITLLGMNNKALEETLSNVSMLQEKIQTLISTLNLYLSQLEDGAKKLSDGTASLKEGVAIITSKTKDLKNGTKDLKEGIHTLQTGIHEFNKEGITPITNFLNQDVRKVTNKMEALVKLSEDYQTFTMKDNSTNGSTKFISVVDSVKIPKEVKKVEKKKEKTTFIDRVKNLFQ